MELIIEEINRGKKLIGRHKFFTNEIQVGRGYHNDMILSDPHVCANHISLKCVDDEWFIEDLGSINGTTIGKKTKITHPQKIQSGDVIVLGKTQLRFILPAHPVVASVKFSAVENVVEMLGRWSVIAALLAVFTGLNVTFMYLNMPTKEVNYNSLFLWGFGLTLAYSLWPLFCSLMAHLNKRETRISDQLGISFLIINLFWIIDFLEAFLGFNGSSDWSGQWFTLLLAIGLTYAMFWFNFYIAFEQTTKRRVKFALGLTTFIYGSLFVYDLSNQPEFKSYPLYNSTIMSPTFAIASPISPDEFISNSDSLFKAVDEESKEE
ncbi:FHA domain-containing protein [Thalassomonas sp. M1454]|uniref:FHA domain-containing protein n=1 Tax=Thalassomonas sp. M1454 TaxID=2594477 RepID=UPI00117E2FB3|nr:FHA domain-containing protein [Thalassomonas sp. M1454]TRX57819.1 FHA domain-containing protein [Thalassomonas sp. M1454]